MAEEAVYLILAAAAVFTRRERRKALALVDVRRAVEAFPAQYARASVSVYRAFRAGGAVFTRQREAFLHVVCTRFSLPASCTQGQMWRADGLLVAGFPLYAADSPDAPLVTEKLEKVLDKSRRENALLLELCADAAEGWSRVQSAFLILRLSLATKFIFYAQTVDPTLALPFARQFDQIIVDSFSKLVDSAQRV
mgnify:CR=1 FL=1